MWLHPSWGENCSDFMELLIPHVTLVHMVGHGKEFTPALAWPGCGRAAPTLGLNALLPGNMASNLGYLTLTLSALHSSLPNAFVKG